MDIIVPMHTPLMINKIGLIDADFIKYRVINKVLKEIGISILNNSNYNQLMDIVKILHI